MNNRKSLSDRRRADHKKKRREKRISDTVGNWIFHGFFPVDKNGKWTDNEDEIVRYKRYDSPHRRTKFLKRQSNKAIRNMDVDEDVALKGGDYKKVFDYQWELH